MIQIHLKGILVLLVTLIMVVNTSAATMNVVIITDPTGKDPNGAAAGSQSWAPNMFQSTFIMSKNKHFAVLSGGEGNETPRLGAIVAAMRILENGGTPGEAANAANSFPGIRVMTGSPTGGAAVGGSFDAYVVTVDNNGTIQVKFVSSGLAVLPPGQKGAIIHLRNTPGNPQYGTATAVRQDTAIMIGKMIRDGYSATDIMGKVFENVAVKSGEKHGGGADNLVSGLTTGDMFTPKNINQTGYSMDQAYSKVCPTDGWSVAFPEADNYQTCPIDGTPLKTLYAYQVLQNSITDTGGGLSISVYGTDAPGITETTQEIVQASVNKTGYNDVQLSKNINRAINNGLLVGVNYVEPKDINIQENVRAIGVYYKPLANKRTSPTWNLPINSTILDVIGNIQTAIGLILVILVLFRSTLITSFLKNRR
jgi:hypothetical protein